LHFAIFILKCCIHEGTAHRLTKYLRCASLALREIAFRDFVNTSRYPLTERARGYLIAKNFESAESDIENNHQKTK